MGTSLDDTIKSRSNRDRWGRRQDQRHGWGQRDNFGRGRDAGTFRRGPLRVNTWAAPYANAKASSKLLLFLLQRNHKMMWCMEKLKFEVPI